MTIFENKLVFLYIYSLILIFILVFISYLFDINPNIHYPFTIILSSIKISITMIQNLNS